MESGSGEEETRSMNIGSIAGGGRYDNLVSMFLSKHKVPCVGISIGIERLFTIMKEKSKVSNVKNFQEFRILEIIGFENLLITYVSVI